MMTLRIKAAALALAAIPSLCPALAQAECSTAAAGARCIRVVDPQARPTEPTEVAMSSASAATPLAQVGDVLPQGKYSIILNADYYGLPPASDGWVYMRVGPDAYRVDWRTHQVLERVTEKAAANF
ncbi:hypothetical protein Rumeso_04011 [Rubellimicrobium mesophilum DSM 19309]|uniref:Uncharacterized protein n=1 Tax=Rubellimicrobium mesophilum DSM 19309 TaxID=442562 RepID=A0A017HL17_9RHOB|nr:hypothetical protein [Rubellimicrobium mesophilum]EYD74474.1 hypothetical protein Rumeso_04011 [Rubellimicrobium mesophilum DSM 19309]